MIQSPAHISQDILLAPKKLHPLAVTLVLPQPGSRGPLSVSTDLPAQGVLWAQLLHPARSLRSIRGSIRTSPSEDRRENVLVIVRRARPSVSRVTLRWLRARAPESTRVLLPWALLVGASGLRGAAAAGPSLTLEVHLLVRGAPTAGVCHHVWVRGGTSAPALRRAGNK